MKINVRKLTLASVLIAVAVVGSLLSFPFLGSKCSPVQHIVNIITGVLLGPWYAVGCAFLSSLIRNIFGIGSLLAFPGSMFGAFLCGLLYYKFKNVTLALIGETFGTVILGGLSAYPIAILLMGQDAGTISMFVYIVPFLISTGVGTIIAGFIVYPLTRTKVFSQMKNQLQYQTIKN